MTGVDQSISISTGTLDALAATLPVPQYDRSRVTVGIVHIGVGAFHRAHEAMYVDRLLATGEDMAWGICGVGVLAGDRGVHDALKSQDGLYTLVLKHPDGRLEPRVIGSIVELLLAPDDPEAVIEKMAGPEIRIVSMTVTEGGYHVSPVTGQFDADDDGITRDLLPDAVPGTAFGLITEALVRRRSRGIAPFTVVSCDNIQGNGHVVRRMLSSFARLRDPELADWMLRQVSFPNSMVDRITPVTAAADRTALADRFGVVDRAPVVCEPYHQWVLEDRFAIGRPALETVGVQVVEDVEPYELMKLRLLNASHQALCYLGYLSGYRYVHEVCQDPLFVDFLLGYMDQEARPTLPPVPGVDLDDYTRTLVARFANPEVRDTLARLCAFSSDRIPLWLLPVVRHQLAAGGPVDRSALVVAAWARYAEGTDEQGRPIEVVDRLADQLQKAALSQREDPTAFLADRQLFGDLIDDPTFVAAYTAALASLHERGARATLEGRA